MLRRRAQAMRVERFCRRQKSAARMPLRVQPPFAEGGSTTAGMQEVEQRREQLPREARLLRQRRGPS